MLKIAICDDDLHESTTVEHLTKTFFKENNIPVEIGIYNDPKTLVSSQDIYDLYLLDVIMPGMTGIEVAAALGTHKHSVVFITSSVESAVDGYSVNADGFIIKPVNKNSYSETMKRVITKNNFYENPSITITYNRTPLKIDLENILYFETKLHTVNIYVKGEKILSVKGKLSDFQEKLNSHKEFLRCHQSYIVNMASISSMEESEFIMKTDAIIPISRSFYKNCKQAYYHYKLK